MELALEADELAAMGLGQTVHDPFLMAAVPNRHSRPPPREAHMHTTRPNSRSSPRRDGLSQ